MEHKCPTNGVCCWHLHDDGQAFICMIHGKVFNRSRLGEIFPPDRCADMKVNKKLVAKPRRKQ